jgi:HEPN domain-containing protein
MSSSRRKTIEGWIEKAGCQLRVAENHLESYYQSSEAIEAAQECVELSVKSILSLLGIKYELKHSWSWEEFKHIAGQIQKERLLEKLTEGNLGQCSQLPRLLILVNLWGNFYLPAKYGFPEYLASAQDLFKKPEAHLAVEHARECYHAALELRGIGEDRLAALQHKRR